AGVECRRESADLHRLFICVKGLRPAVINVVGPGAVDRTQMNRCGVPVEHRSPSRRCADLLSVGWKVDIERALAPYQLKERPVHRMRKPECDASSIRE